jgi:hypothetical protein
MRLRRSLIANIMAIALTCVSLVLCNSSSFELFSYFIAVPAILAIVLGAVELLRAAPGGVPAPHRLVVGIATSLSVVQIAVSLLVLPSTTRSVRDTTVRNYLAQIGLGLRSYQTSYGTFPPVAVTDPSGNPLLSWRVLILPFMEHGTLFDRFKLDEAWDGPHNYPLLSEMPYFFGHPGAPAKRYETCYLASVGRGAAFEEGMALSDEDFTDGIQHTITVIEAAQFVPWTSPVDLHIEEQPLSQSVGFDRDRIFRVLWAGGHVDRIDKGIDEQHMRSWITRNGGEPWIPPPPLRAR